MTRSALLAELPTPERLVEVIHRIRERGHDDLEAFLPYPVEEVEEALRLRRSRAGFFMFAAGALGAGGAYLLQWLINVILYPLNVGARPDHFPLIFIPITFEMGVLFASLGGFFAFLWLAGLLRLWYPQAAVPAFVSASRDRFWLQVSGDWDERGAGDVAAALRDWGALDVVWIDGGRP